MQNYGVILIADSIQDCIEFTNDYAPEHLEIMTDDDWSVVQRITNTGSIFLGPYSTEPAGDYASGGNHVLPTNGYAKMFQALSVDAFVRRVQVQELTLGGLAAIRSTVGALADAEGFAAHKRAVEARFQ